MEFTYDNILKFMQDYFRDFNLYSHDPATAQRLYAYFAPDLEFIPYVAGNRYLKGRDKFLRLLYSHPSSREKLAPAEIIIAEKQKIAVVLIKAELLDSATREVLVAKSYLVVYQLMLDTENTIKIKQIRFFEEILPKGALDLGDVFSRDPAMVKTLTDD